MKLNFQLMTTSVLSENEGKLNWFGLNFQINYNGFDGKLKETASIFRLTTPVLSENIIKRT